MEGERLIRYDSRLSISGSLKIRLYSMRWFLDIGLAIEGALTVYAMSSFGTVNDVLVAYFDVSYEAIDWLFLAHYVVMVTCAPILAWCNFTGALGFRKLELLRSFTILLCYLGQMVAAIWPILFPLMIFGQFINGISYLITLASPAILAVNWFPDNQIGTALFVAASGISFGNLMAFILPALTLTSPSSLTSFNNSTLNVTCQSKLCAKWHMVDRKNLLIMDGTFLLIAFLVFLFVIFFAKDLPPTPPTFATHHRTYTGTGFQRTEKTFKDYSKQLQELLTDRTFISISFCFGIAHSLHSIETVFFGEIIRGIVVDIGLTTSPNLLSGYALLTLGIGMAFGVTIIGQVVNKNKNYVMQGKFASIVLGLSVTGVFIGSYLTNIVVVFIGNFFFGLSSGIALGPFYELSTQHTFPKDEVFVNIVMIGLYTPISIIITIVSRVLLNNFGGLSVMIFQTVYSWVMFILVAFMRPTYKRLNVERSHSTVFQ